MLISTSPKPVDTWQKQLPNCKSVEIMPLRQSSFTTCIAFTALSTYLHPQRNRYCLRSLHGFATEDGFTENPSEAIQIAVYEVAIKRLEKADRPDLSLQLITFEKHGDHWKPITTT